MSTREVVSLNANTEAIVYTHRELCWLCVCVCVCIHKSTLLMAHSHIVSVCAYSLEGKLYCPCMIVCVYMCTSCVYAAIKGFFFVFVR